jgi:hypothetical protein
MLEQVQTGIRLQHTLVKGLMNTAELVWAFAQTLDSHYQNCANQLVSSVPEIQASKNRLKTQVPTAAAAAAAASASPLHGMFHCHSPLRQAEACSLSVTSTLYLLRQRHP